MKLVNTPVNSISVITVLHTSSGKCEEIGGTFRVKVIIIGSKSDYLSSNSEQSCLHFP